MPDPTRTAPVHSSESRQGEPTRSRGIGVPVHDLTSFLASAEAPDELGRLGKYRILKILGHGGMGVVFLAEDARLKRRVALKAMLPAMASRASACHRFLREAQAMAALEHDHIVRLYQVDEDRGVPFLAMEILKGETLHDRLHRDGKPALPEAVRIGREMAEGLAAAHEAGLIHRDVKPANVWLEAPRGRVKILDFGLARAASTEASLTQEGMIVGTPAFMSPEQARGVSVDARCDLFSLGCVLYRMLTGQHPFTGLDAVSTLLAVASHEPPSPARLDGKIPPELSALVMGLLEKDPGKRPTSAAAVAEALRGLEGKPEPTGAKAGGGQAYLLLAVCLLALLPLGWWLASRPRVKAATGTLVVEMSEEAEPRSKDVTLVLSGPEGGARRSLGPGERQKEMAAGTYRIRVEGADGLRADPREFTLEKGGRATVRVTAVPSVAAKGAADRELALHVLLLGGSVGVADLPGEIKVAADLPQGPFRLTGVNLNDCKVTEKDLARFKGFDGLARLHLADTQVGDQGLAHLKGCKELRHLSLANTKVGDAGLAHLVLCKELSGFGLSGTRIRSEGLAHFKDSKRLADLRLDRTEVGDEGLAHLKGCENLVSLHLSGTKVTDGGLAVFKGRDNLNELVLTGTKVTDAGLANFKGCKGLARLHLDGTTVSDKGLAHFKDCKELSVIRLPPGVSDLSFLKGTKLVELECEFKPELHADLLRSIPTLETINGKPAKEFLKQAGEKKR